MTKIRGPTAGQFNIEGQIFGLDKIVTPPEVIEDQGLKVVHLAISEYDNSLPGFTSEALVQARKIIPEVKSKGKPIWFTQEYQARRRMKKYGANK